MQHHAARPSPETPAPIYVCKAGIVQKRGSYKVHKAGEPDLGAVRDSPIFAVAMLLKVEVSQAADVPHALHKDCVVTHKVQDGVGAVGQGEVQHKRGQQYAGHLLHEQARLHTQWTLMLRQVCVQDSFDRHGVWSARGIKGCGQRAGHVPYDNPSPLLSDDSFCRG